MKKKSLKKSLPNFVGKRVLICLVLALAFVNFTFAQEDMTDRLVNPSFEDGTGGWTFDGISAYKISTGEKAGGLIPGGQNHLQLWTGSGGIKGKVYQEISGLPNGKYSLSAAFSSSFSGTVYLYANEGKTTVVSGNNKYYEVTGVVFNGSIEVGIEVATTGSPTIDFDDFTLSFLGSADMVGVLVSQSEKLASGRDSLSVLGFTAAASELTVIIDKYADYDENTSEGEVEAAVVDVENHNVIVLDILIGCSELQAAIVKSEKLLADCEAGIYVVGNPVKENLSAALEVAKGTMQSASMAELFETIDGAVEAIGEAYGSTINIISISYPLLTAKTLADKIGGLESTAEYQKVSADLLEEELSFAELVSDVQALNLVCKNAMTLEFLSTATGESPIDLTSFITNPNIYQSGASAEMPIGWTCIHTSADNKKFTVDEYSDSHFMSYSWSGNAGNNQIGKSHYFQKIGGDAEGSVGLPDGLYVVKAATYTSAGSNEIRLYATSDSVNFIQTGSNTNMDIYDNARKELGTTTELLHVEARSGVLYLGIKGKDVDGEGHVTGAGKVWHADNFRLYYVDSFAKLNNDNGAVSVSGDLEAALEEIAEIENITSLDLSNTTADEGATVTVKNPNTIVYGLPGGVTLGTCIDAQDKETPFLLCEEHSFNAPIACEEVNLQYVRNFTTTTNNNNGGWQSIVLPFDVETITAIQDGEEIELIPFAQWDEMGAEEAKNQELRPFWLLEAAYDESIKDEGYASADAIKANVPYLLAIPNDPAFYDAYYNVSGDVTFSGKGIQVTKPYSEEVKNEDEGVNYTLNTNFNGPTDNVYGLNDIGTEWVAGIDANSFHLYVITSQANAPQRIAIFGNGGGGTTGIKGIFSDFGKGQNGIGKAVVYGSKEGIVIESVKAGEAAIYSVSGELVKIAQVKEGRNIIKVPAGVYIINKNKVIVY